MLKKWKGSRLSSSRLLSGLGGDRQASTPTPTPAWPGGLAHLGVIGLVGRANRQNLGLHTTESLMIVCIRVQFSAQSPGRERVEELWKGNRLD